MENGSKNTELEFNLKYFSDKLPKNILSTKKVLLQSNNEDQILYPDMSGDTDLQQVHHCFHNESEFNIFCLCKYCLDYRNDLLQIFNDHDKTQKIWKQFQTAFSKFYLPLVGKVPQDIMEQYADLISKKSNWFVNGIINKVKQKHIDFILDFPWTDKMIVVIFSTILTEDDPHQLFELMTFILECFVKQYAASLTTNFLHVCDSISPSKFLLTYILTGYEKMCSIADLMSDMLFVFERNYLEKFKCSWVLLNKKIYEKYFYSIVRTIIPEFLIKLKEEVPNYEYKSFITKFNKFEMDMILTENSWQEINVLLQIYDNSEDNHIRKTGIEYIQTLFKNIHENCQFNKNIIHAAGKSNDVEWEKMISSIKKNWNIQEKENKIELIMEENNCQRCQFLLQDNKTSPTTLTNVEEATTQHVFCIKCTFMEASQTKDCNLVTKLSRISLDDKISENMITGKNSEEFEIAKVEKESMSNFLKTEEYHYCWAVFKHLKDRKSYENTIIEPDFFCKNCQRTSCLLTIKILNKEISDEVVKYLIKYYQPFAITNEEILEMLPKIWLCFKNGHFPHDHFDEDFIIKIFWIFVISAYATCFASLDNTKSIPALDSLILKSNEIELSFPIKESNLQSSGLLEFIEKIINLLQANRSNQKMPIIINKDMKLGSLIVSDTDNNNDNLSLLSKEVSIRNDSSDKLNVIPRNVCKSDIMPNAECKNSDKDASSNKPTCFHDKEHRHNRKNETRDRLRKKLKKLVTFDKNPPSLPQKFKETFVVSNNNNLQSPCTNSNERIISNKNVKSNNNSYDKQNDGESKVVNISDINTVCEKKTTSKWVKDALSYIEGSKNETNLVNNKKAAKRQKQKMKKEESKRIDELIDLRSQFHEVYFKEFMAKKERKSEQLSKKKDKKRILELENSVKKLSKIKLRIERDILQLIATLKSINPEFKFTYLPTKEQQENFLQNSSHAQESIANCNKSIDAIKIQKENIIPIKTNQQVPLCEQNEFISFSKTEQDTEMSDTSKRIVTIRRVNMLNNNEPQVTVTAKGSSPDEDKVLYTFINGRLVHRDSGNISLLENSQRINFTQLSEIKSALFQNNNIMSCFDSNPNSDNITPKIKTKTQLKKERKLAKQKLIEQLNDEKKQNINLKTNTQVLKKENILKHFKPSEYQIESNNETTNSSNKCKQKKEYSKCNQNVEKELKIHEIRNKSRTNCTQKADSTLNQHNVSKLFEKTILHENNIKIVKKSDKPKTKNRQMHNMKIMENNQFNLLNIDDNESFTEESESDTDNVTCKNYSLENKCILNKNKNKIKSKGPTVKSKIEKSNTGLKNKAKCNEQTVNNKKNCLKNVKDNVQSTSNYTNITKPSEKQIFGLEESMNNLNINFNNNNDNLMRRNDVNNISIMEQLKRGIQVENLTLPPGITLTKVNSAKVEELKAKTTAIHNLSKPIVPPQQPPPVHSMFNAEHLLTSEFISPTVNKFLTDTKGVIKVDNISNKSIPQKNVPQCVNDCKNKTKLKKRKRNKSKSKIRSRTETNTENKNVASNVITLRNPMFYLSNQEGIPYCNLADRLPQTSDAQIDQPATIIRNKNGMFTIRNPVLYQNMAQSNLYNNFGSFSPNYYTLRSYQQNGDSNSYISGNASNDSGKCVSAHQKQCTMFQNQNLATDTCNHNGLKSFVPPESMFYNNCGNYCGSTAPITRNSENLQQKNGTYIQNKNVQISRLLDLKRLSKEVTIENSFTSKGMTKASNQGKNIDIQTSHSNELENQHTHFKNIMLSDK